MESHNRSRADHVKRDKGIAATGNASRTPGSNGPRFLDPGAPFQDLPRQPD
jgi:hypothetical protein